MSFDTQLIVFIRPNQIYSEPIRYVLDTMSRSFSLILKYEENKEICNIIFDDRDSNSSIVNVEFYTNILQKRNFSHHYYFTNRPLMFVGDNVQNPDYIGTIFYMINCFQEFDQNPNTNLSDEFGRFKYTSSFQYKFNCITENLVYNYFKFFLESKNIKFELKVKKSRVFLSHDIDSVNGSFLQDGLWAFKRGRLDILALLIFKEILKNPDWKNIDLINKIHDEHGLKSTFFWLATNKVDKVNRIKNSDYSLRELKSLSNKSCINGLHKSCLNLSINEELKILPFQTNINRYHFLNFQLPKAWDDIEQSNLVLDASLGFAEHFGFRNCFSLPFQPYNLSLKKSYNFLIVPLNVMDGTFQKYLKIPTQDTARHIIDFFEINKTNAIISILWHNTFFSNYKYKGFLNEYKKILFYLNENEITSINPSEMIELYG